MSKMTISDIGRKIDTGFDATHVLMGELDKRTQSGFDATHTFMRELDKRTQSGFDASHALIGELDKRNQTGFDATHALMGEHDSREEARTGKVISEIRKNSANPKKSWGLLILAVTVGVVLAALSYWFVIHSGLCHLGGLWREVANRDAAGNIIVGSYVFELVEGAKVIWGALSVAMGAAVAALLHAIIPWYREEVR